MPRGLQFISTNRIDAMTRRASHGDAARGFSRTGFRHRELLAAGTREFNKAHIHRTSSRCCPPRCALGITPFLDLILSSPRAHLRMSPRHCARLTAGCGRAARSGMYPYVIPFSGAAFARDPRLLPHTVIRATAASPAPRSSGTRRRRSCRSTPRCARSSCASSSDFEATLAALQQHVAHLPSRVRSLVWILCSLPILAEYGHSHRRSARGARRARGASAACAGGPRRLAVANAMRIRRSRGSLLAPLGVCALLRVDRAVGGQRAGGELLRPGLRPRQSHRLYGCARFALRLYVRRRHTATARGAGATSGPLDRPRAGDVPGMRRVVPIAPYAIIASVYQPRRAAR